MKIKASQEMIFESQLKAGRGAETPGWPTEMEAWRKKRGVTQELSRDMLLEMRLGSRQGPSHLKPCKRGSTLSSVLERNRFYRNQS